jgi:hypothetical protein
MSSQNKLSYKNSAEDRTRTCTGLHPLDPESTKYTVKSIGCDMISCGKIEKIKTNQCEVTTRKPMARESLSMKRFY